LTANSNKSANSNASTPTTITGGANGWLQPRSGGVQTTNTNWTGGNTTWGSSWLLLKNLTAQVCSKSKFFSPYTVTNVSNYYFN